MAARHELVAGAGHDPARQHRSCWCRFCSTRIRAPSTAFRFRCSPAPPTAPCGSNLPALMRALVACGWFGIQAWIGGEALQTFFIVDRSGLARRCSGGQVGGHTTTEWLSFLLFWGLNIFIIYRGMDLLRVVENWAAPVRPGDDGDAARAGRCGGPMASVRCCRSPESSTPLANSCRFSFLR